MSSCRLLVQRISYCGSAKSCGGAIMLATLPEIILSLWMFVLQIHRCLTFKLQVEPELF